MQSPKTQDKLRHGLVSTQEGADISELKRVVSVKFEKDIRQRFEEANYQIKSKTIINKKLI
jgi:predicted secreted protein